MKNAIIGFGALSGALALAIGTALGPAVGPAAAQTAQPSGIKTATAALQDAEGNSVGQVTLTQYMNGVVLHGELQGLPPGWHGLHIHQTGECAPSFAAAGEHFNPNETQHGLDEEEPHAGDLANIWAADDGTAQFELMTDRVSLGAPEVAMAGEEDIAPVMTAPSLFDEDGAALMVHAQPDDYATDPSGSSGDRIACGVIEQG